MERCVLSICKLFFILIIHMMIDDLAKKLKQKIDFESQILTLFETSPLTQFSKFDNFPLDMLIFRKKIFPICIPCLKTQQPLFPYYTVMFTTTTATFCYF